MAKKYLKIADLVPPAALDAYMNEKNHGKGYFDKLFEKYKEYQPVALRHSMNGDQYCGAVAMLHVIFECLEKVLNEQQTN